MRFIVVLGWGLSDFSRRQREMLGVNARLAGITGWSQISDGNITLYTLTALRVTLLPNLLNVMILNRESHF